MPRAGFTNGFSFSRPLVYLSTDANDPLAAALEKAILAPGLNDVIVGRDDSFNSGVERLFAVINGPRNTVEDEVNPQRQGFESALSGDGGPLNVFGGIPTLATDYSPIWDFNLGEWTTEAIELGYRSRITDEFTWLGMVQRGFVTGPGGAGVFWPERAHRRTHECFQEEASRGPQMLQRQAVQW